MSILGTPIYLNGRVPCLKCTYIIRYKEARDIWMARVEQYSLCLKRFKDEYRLRVGTAHGSICRWVTLGHCRHGVISSTQLATIINKRIARAQGNAMLGNARRS